jgi:hypothetical protein
MIINFIKLHKQRIILGLAVLLIFVSLFVLSGRRAAQVENLTATDPSTGMTVIVNELIFYDISEQELKNAIAEYEGELRNNPREDINVHAATFPVESVQELRVIKNEFRSRGIKVSFNAISAE